MPDGTTLTNSATVVSAERPTPVGDDGSLVVAATADVRIAKTASSAGVHAGTPLDYTLAVANNGPSDARDVVVTDTLPAGARRSSRSTRRAPTRPPHG